MDAADGAMGVQLDHLQFGDLMEFGRTGAFLTSGEHERALSELDTGYTERQAELQKFLMKLQ